MIVCYNFIWLTNLRGILYHKIASLAQNLPNTPSSIAGSPKMRSPCRMPFSFLPVAVWGLPCFLLFPCLFFTLPFFFVFLAFVLFLWGSFCLTLISFAFEFNFHFTKLISLLIIHIWRLEQWKKIPSRLANKEAVYSFPPSVSACFRKLHLLAGQSCDSEERCLREKN